MSETKHTPGPWHVETNRDNTLAQVFSPDRWVVNVEVEGPNGVERLGDEDAANAHLIAAAPELLEALEMVRDADEDCIKDGFPRWCTDVARKAIDAALAKAEGRQP